ncbi:NUDIX hydrolase [Treponema parvum]|uniref:NUDIX hydrolase n=1 Tax=Treponema parvum TaxID=138851 RepID=UPI001AEC300F|nr:NUDIX hydrolase [Treponema parvum]QTQ15577.1 NUDIX hydrolase [Treponema parvum]
MDTKDDDKLAWHERSQKLLLKTPVMDITQTDSMSPDGEMCHYIVMNAPDWVITVPVLGDKLLMVRQWRHGEKNMSVEFPGGVSEKNETPEQAAKRELKEETGYTANKMVFLGSVNPNPALMSNHVHIFAAYDLENSGEQSLDSDEYINLMKVSKKEVLKNLGTKEYQHALMSTAMAFFMRYENSL